MHDPDTALSALGRRDRQGQGAFSSSMQTVAPAGPNRVHPARDHEQALIDRKVIRGSTTAQMLPRCSMLNFPVCADQRTDDVMIVRRGGISEVRARRHDQGPAMLGEMPSDRGRQCMGQQLVNIRAREKGCRALLVHVFDRSHLLIRFASLLTTSLPRSVRSVAHKFSYGTPHMGACRKGDLADVDSYQSLSLRRRTALVVPGPLARGSDTAIQL